MTRFLIDEDLPPSLSVLLRQEGHETAHIIELGPRGSSDAAIFKLAQEREAVLVSRDLGFANILQYAPGSHHGIVVVRFPSEMRTRVLVAEVIARQTAIRSDEFYGALIVLEPGRTRIRRSV
jgi:predicted nuclease of predicted toxin-antitoxin system